MAIEEAVLTVLAAVLASVATVIGTLFIHERRLRREFQTEFMAEKAVKKLLMHANWKQRSFDEIAKKLGGFEGEELRKLLVRSGAVRFQSKDNTELWGLMSRNEVE